MTTANQTILSNNTGTSNISNVETMSWMSAASTMVLVILAPTLAILLQVISARTRTRTNRTNNQSSHQRQHQHSRRRLQHALTGLLFYILSFLLTHFTASLLLATATTLFYILHISRSKSKAVQQYYIQQFGPLLREHEQNIHTIPGAFWFLLGTTIIYYFFDIDIARTSLLCLSFGDPIASTMGMNFGGPKVQFRHGSKSLVGCCSCFITCVIISMLCMGFKYGQGLWILTGFIATLMECLSGLVGIDDNMLIPLGTGATLSFYLYCMDLQFIGGSSILE